MAFSLPCHRALLTLPNFAFQKSWQSFFVCSYQCPANMVSPFTHFILWILFQSLVLVCNVKNPRNARWTPKGTLSASARMKGTVPWLLTLYAAVMAKRTSMSVWWKQRLVWKECQFTSWWMVIVVSEYNLERLSSLQQAVESVLAKNHFK